MTTFRLRECRERAGMSQSELARQVNLSSMQISNLDRGARNPSWQTAINIAIALGCSLDELAGIDSQEHKP